MKLIKTSLPEDLLILKDSIFFIWDKVDGRVLAVLNLDKDKNGVIYVYRGFGFKKSGQVWEVFDKVLPVSIMIESPDRFDYTKQWAYALEMGESND